MDDKKGDEENQNDDNLIIFLFYGWKLVSVPRDRFWKENGSPFRSHKPAGVPVGKRHRKIQKAPADEQCDRGQDCAIPNTLLLYND